MIGKYRIPKELFPYYSHRSRITYHVGILLKNQKIMAPTTLCSEIKSIIHQGHFGPKNSKKHARQALFWPLIQSEIEDMIKNCHIFWPFVTRNTVNPSLSTQEPWTKLTAGLFWLYRHHYLLVADYNSKFVAVENLKNSQSLAVFDKCKKIFLQYGIPKEPITDNGPEFTSHRFKKFSKS